MKTLRKRLTCANRNDFTKNNAAIHKVKKAYIKRMAANGWFYFETLADVCGGNSFFQYEMYISLFKPNLNSEKDLKFIEKYTESSAKEEHAEVVRIALAKGLKKDGLYVMHELKAKGWTNLAYLKYAAKHKSHSNYFVNCGYSGCYNHSKLVKLLF